MAGTEAMAEVRLLWGFFPHFGQPDAVDDGRSKRRVDSSPGGGDMCYPNLG